jgi:ubiquinone/menaquinone biosynthesis C-methylase UbiE
MVLNPHEAKRYYDWFGKKQDSQSFYEDKAVEDLVAHGEFNRVGNVFEFGCGTGRFAEKLLKIHLPAAAAYTGCDLSSTMVGLARQRLENFKERGRVIQTDGAVRFPIEDSSTDRVVCTYVLDLMSEEDIEAFFLEAHRVLNPGGKLCLVSLTRGKGLLSGLVSAVWASIFRMKAILVGGCRPIKLLPFLDTNLWRLEYDNVVIAYGVPSEVLVAGVKK